MKQDKSFCPYLRMLISVFQEEYNKRCAAEISQLLASVSSELLEEGKGDEHEDDMPPVFPNSGTSIGRYTHAEHIDEGITAEIFRALDPTTNKLVALKVTHPSSTTPPHDCIREARLLSKAKGPHIIPLLETFRHLNGEFVLVFPYKPYDLNVLLHQTRLDSLARKSILRDLFSALAHLHSLGIIHRDIKPSNILLQSLSGSACLADFGISYHPSDPSCEPADKKITDVGTTCYRPPEILFGFTSYTEKLDIWAAGCVAAQIVALGPRTLFDAGDVGSELALIKSIFENLGTPDQSVWPECVELPDWGKMSWKKYPGKTWDEILPGIEEEGRDLLKRLVVFESGRRMSAGEVSNGFHPVGVMLTIGFRLWNIHIYGFKTLERGLLMLCPSIPYSSSGFISMIFPVLTPISLITNQAGTRATAHIAKFIYMQPTLPMTFTLVNP